MLFDRCNGARSVSQTFGWLLPGRLAGCLAVLGHHSMMRSLKAWMLTSPGCAKVSTREPTLLRAQPSMTNATYTNPAG